jgi:hypothetical protein
MGVARSEFSDGRGATEIRLTTPFEDSGRATRNKCYHSAGRQLIFTKIA